MSVGKKNLSVSCRLLCLLIVFLYATSTYGKSAQVGKEHKAAFIVCSDMVDEGLYESIRRRTKEALDAGATYLIYEMDTFGGRVDSAISIHNYILGDVARQAHTVAYVRTKAISAGALISVACQDIIMKANAKLGDCAPISMSGKIEGIEREKIESPLRSYFKDAARTNGYPIALCKAMVTIGIEVYKIKNLQTDKFEYVEGTMINNKPFNDPNVYDVEDKILIDTKEELLTVDADEAKEYGLSRTIVDGSDEQAREKVLRFLEDRDGISFDRPATYLKTNWSEELVRWLTNPVVSGILMMVAMLGIYAELNSPGLGLPGTVAVVALVILFGSKFLIGMANWWEIAMFVIGLCLLIAEIFVIPGFGIAGISGTFMMIFALGAMMVGNKPDEWPVPVAPFEWDMFEKQLFWMMAGCAGFIIGAYFIGRYLPKIPVANRLILATPHYSVDVRSGGVAAPAPPPPVKVGDQGMSTGQLRPSGFGRFGNNRLDVVTRGELVEPNRKITVVEIEGNSIVVKEV